MTTVLVVDDSPADQHLVGCLLKKEAQFQTVFASDGKQAVAELERQQPDLVLTDLHMPEMNGLELVSSIKKNHPLIPVVLMTAEGSEEIAVKALQVGAASYVPKSKLARDLHVILRRVLDASIEDLAYADVMKQITKSNYVFVLENDIGLISPLTRFLRQTIHSTGLCDHGEQLRVAIAVEEALLNAYYHGNLEVSSDLRDADDRAFFELAKERSQQDPYRNRQIRFQASLSQTEASFSIRDDGPGFNPSKLPDPTDAANVGRPCGRGVLLMRTFMDSVSFSETGSEVTLTKNRSAASE